MISEKVIIRNYLTHITEYKSDTTSLQSIPVLFISEEFPNSSISQDDIQNSLATTLLKKEPIYSEIWDEISRERKKQQDRQRAQLVLELKQKLFYALKRNSAEGDGVSPAEQLVINIAQEHSFRILGEVAQEMYLQYNDYPNILTGLCECLERFDGEEVMPWGPIMLMGLLCHKNESVKEAAAILVENWAEISLLPALRNIEVHSDWLKAYIESVIKGLEGREKDVLRKKAI